MEFKDVLRMLRLREGMTQQELADKVGLKREAIHKYEKGIVVNPKRSLIAKLAIIFNVSPSYLLCIDDSAENNLTDAELLLITEFRKLNQDGQKAALGVVHAYTLMDV